MPTSCSVGGAMASDLTLLMKHAAIQTKRHQRLIGLRLELAHRGHLLRTHCLDAAVKTFGNLYKAVDFHPEVTHWPPRVCFTWKSTPARLDRHSAMEWLACCIWP